MLSAARVLGLAAMVALAVAALPRLVLVVHTRPTRARLQALHRVLASIDAARQRFFDLRIQVAVDSYRPPRLLPEEDDLAQQGYPALNVSLTDPGRDPYQPVDYDSLRSATAPLSVHINANATTTEFLLGLWSPASDDETAVFLNEATHLSPRVYEYIHRIVDALPRLSSSILSKVFGVSLHTKGVYSEITDRRTEARPSNFVLAQEPDLFGAVLFPRKWRDFNRWFMRKHLAIIDPVVPYSHTNRWDPRLHWRKWLLRYMYETGGGMLFPPSGVLGESSGLVVGRHWDQLYRQVKRYKPIWRLVETSRVDGLFQFTRDVNTFRSIALMNVHGEAVSDVSGLHNVDALVFDKCTLILTMHTRARALRSRILHFSDWKALDRVVVVWNLPSRQPPSIFRALFPVPVVIVPMTSSSLNNRFAVSSFVNTSCVVSMDDDWLMPLDHLQYAFDVWRKQFFDYLVGFRHLGRAHAYRDGKYRYASERAHGISMVLPSGLFMDRKYLEMYSSLPKHLLDFVDRHTNCEDILLNFMVANHTRRGPIVVNRIASELRVLGDSGLSIRSNHTKVRHECMQFFARAFGNMPLSYFGWDFGVTRRQELIRSHFAYDVPHEREVWFSRTPTGRCDPYRPSLGKCRGMMQWYTQYAREG